MQLVIDKKMHIEPGGGRIVSPNPTDYQVTFDWSQFGTGGKVMIRLTDQAGNLVDILKPDPGTGRYEWNVSSVVGTGCHYVLLIDGQEVDSGQIIIAK